MKKILLLVSLFCISICSSFGQHFSTCGFDQYLQDLSVQELNNFDQLISRKLEQQNTPEMDVVIPVVFHIIHPNDASMGSVDNLSNAQLVGSLDRLNQAFANEGDFSSSDGTPTGIQFCLAQRTPDDAPTTGINRVASTLVERSACGGYSTNRADDLAIKSLSNWNCRDYLNIWVVTDLYADVARCGLAGYAKLPVAVCGIDGIVIEGAQLIVLCGSTN